MEQAQNSDSETHVEMLNWTSGTDLNKKSLCCIFLGHPVLRVGGDDFTDDDDAIQWQCYLLGLCAKQRIKALREIKGKTNEKRGYYMYYKETKPTLLPKKFYIKADSE